MAAMRLLVASDDQALLSLFNTLSARRDHEVIVFSDEQQMLDDQDRTRPDLIVIDLDGRNRAGLRLMETLAQRHCTSQVVLTGSCNVRTLGAAGRVGRERGLSMAPPLPKPLDETVVVSAVLDLLRSDSLRIRPRDIEAALEHDELRLFYQPLVELKTGRVWGAEALLRWQHPQFGWLQPAHVIPVAEKHGLISPITRWVARTAMAQHKLWCASGVDMRMAINVSAQVLRNPDFADEISSMMTEAQVEPRTIVLEITESQTLTEEIEVLDTLTRLRLEEVELAVDDFGTGYSSLGRLHRMPFSELKIDKSFVMDAPRDADAEVIVNTITDLGRNLGMTVIAEGVASREAWDLVERLGCDVAQGFFIARPLSSDDFGRWLNRWGTPQNHTPQSAPTLPTPNSAASNGDAHTQNTHLLPESREDGEDEALDPDAPDSEALNGHDPALASSFDLEELDQDPT